MAIYENVNGIIKQVGGGKLNIKDITSSTNYTTGLVPSAPTDKAFYINGLEVGKTYFIQATFDTLNTTPYFLYGNISIAAVPQNIQGQHCYCGGSFIFKADSKSINITTVRNSANTPVADSALLSYTVLQVSD